MVNITNATSKTLFYVGVVLVLVVGATLMMRHFSDPSPYNASGGNYAEKFKGKGAKSKSKHKSSKHKSGFTSKPHHHHSKSKGKSKRSSATPAPAPAAAAAAPGGGMPHAAAMPTKK